MVGYNEMIYHTRTDVNVGLHHNIDGVYKDAVLPVKEVILWR